MSRERIGLIHDAAVQLFLHQGYGRTQISHIAKAVGISVGTIYAHFGGKREILQFILKRAVDPEFMPEEGQLITADLFPDLEQEIMSAFGDRARIFSERLERGIVDYPFAQLISDTYDMLADYGVCCLFIEKNPTDCGGLLEPYRAYRRTFFQMMTDYMRHYIQLGELRPLDHVELSANLIIELLSWWAMDRPYISFEAQAREISDELAKTVCMDNILTAYCR